MAVGNSTARNQEFKISIINSGLLRMNRNFSYLLFCIGQAEFSTSGLSRRDVIEPDVHGENSLIHWKADCVLDLVVERNARFPGSSIESMSIAHASFGERKQRAWPGSRDGFIDDLLGNYFITNSCNQ